MIFIIEKRKYTERKPRYTGQCSGSGIDMRGTAGERTPSQSPEGPSP